MVTQPQGWARFLVACAVGVILYIGHAAFAPLTLALLCALLLSGPVERLHKRRVPRGLSASLMLMAAIGGLVGSVNLLWNPAQEWYHNAPQTLNAIKLKVKPLAAFVQHTDELLSSTNPETVSPAVTPDRRVQPTVIVPASPSVAPTMFIGATGNFLASCVVCITVTLFLLVGGPPMVARMTVALVDDLHAFHVMQLIDNVRAEVGQFYLATALLNLALGSMTAAIMSLFGMPSPLLWGAIAAVLNFIPLVGSSTMLVLLGIIALVSFDSVPRVLGVMGSYLGIAALLGQLVQPLLVGKRLSINPLVVFLAVWLGGLFWGVSGIILAMPVLLTLKVIAQHSKNGRRLRAFLGSEKTSRLVEPVAKWVESLAVEDEPIEDDPIDEEIIEEDLIEEESVEVNQIGDGPDTIKRV